MHKKLIMECAIIPKRYAIKTEKAFTVLAILVSSSTYFLHIISYACNMKINTMTWAKMISHYINAKNNWTKKSTTGSVHFFLNVV